MIVKTCFELKGFVGHLASLVYLSILQVVDYCEFVAYLYLVSTCYLPLFHDYSCCLFIASVRVVSILFLLSINIKCVIISWSVRF